MKPRSLRSKFLLVAAGNLLLLVLVIAAAVQWQLGLEFDSFLLATAREHIDVVSSSLISELGLAARANSDEILRRYRETYGVTFLLVRNDGSLVAGPSLNIPAEVVNRLRGAPQIGPPVERRPPPPPSDRPPPPDRKEGGPKGPFDFAQGRPGRDRPAPPFLVMAKHELPFWVGVRVPIYSQDEAGAAPGTLLIASPTLLTNPFFFRPAPWLAIAGGAIVVTLLCWLPLVSSLTRSISRLLRATSEIAEGRFDVTVDTARGDELGRLGSSIHRMASRLKSLLEGQKRFLGDVAHELRSPLARMELGLELVERDGMTPQRLADIRDDVAQMSRLTDELLAVAKAELRPDLVALAPTNLLEIVNRAIKSEVGSHASVRLDVDPALQVTAEPDLLTRAVANVLRNAVRYAGQKDPIAVRAERNGATVSLSIADSGPGLPPDALEAVFTPFYRVESSRAKSGGGTGLGLSIVRSSVEACRGTVSCRNREPNGLVVTIRLPSA